MSGSAKPADFDQIVQASREQRAQVRRLVQTGRWREAEPNRDRMRAFNARERAMLVPRSGAEAIIGDDDMQGAVYLPAGAGVRRAVAYVEVNDIRSSTVGTGFLISPQLFITNCHVIGDVAAAHAAQLTFDREAPLAGGFVPTTSYALDPDAFALFSQVSLLDYAVIAVGQRTSGSATLGELGFCALSNVPDRHVIGMHLNIVQHPMGLPKMIAIRNNILTYRTDRTLLYETDTDHGSSGSPVFNDTWDVVALHHWGQPSLELKDENGVNIPSTVNEGVRISAIYTDLQRQLTALTGQKQALLEEALSFVQLPAADASDRVLGPPRMHPVNAESFDRRPANAPVQRIQAMSQGTELRVTIPVELTIRVGDGAGASASATQSAALATALATRPVVPSLTRAAESLQVDQDYENRQGYAADFIPGVEIPLPEPNAALAKQVAPLRAQEPNAATGELKYEHFSLKMNKAKRIAMFTATNIDGATYLAVDRGTGEVSDGAEGDKWFIDPRISESFTTEQDFYKEWSIYFDRGHLTRRTDPSWGTAEEAERANADTFHWTNCSPQHFRFNQTTKFWQGAERYVLENGMLGRDERKRIVVFQGPLYNDETDRYAGDLQIPSSFFKIIVWPGNDRLKSVGLVVDQSSLLDEKRVTLGPPHDVPAVNVQQWRVAVPTIEKRAGLSFGDQVRNADTIASVAQPNVGEALIRIRSFEDILR